MPVSNQRETKRGSQEPIDDKDFLDYYNPPKGSATRATGTAQVANTTLLSSALLLPPGSATVPLCSRRRR